MKKKTTRLRKPKKSRLKIKSILIAAVTGIVIYFLFFAGPRNVVQYFKQKSHKKTLIRDINSLNKEKEQLKKESERLKNDLDYIEKIAREKYNMKKKDEKVYKIIKEK